MDTQLTTLLQQLDRRILSLSPQRDVFLLRLIVALLAVIFLAMDALYGMPFFYWLGLPFYLFCLALYVQGLVKSLLTGSRSAARWSPGSSGSVCTFPSPSSAEIGKRSKVW
ncbi:MAG: hypothetical protein LOY00_05160 [Methylocaldum sp.]|nr:hypothetical protein [Methylocaldum sp.]